MSTEKNKRIIQEFVEHVWNQGSFEVVDELVASGFINHDTAPGQDSGREGVKHLAKAFLQAFPDLRWKIDDIVAEGDKVAYRWSFLGTHQGPFLPLGVMEPTGRTVSITGHVMVRLQNEKIMEQWRQVDALGMLQQLGVLQR